MGSDKALLRVGEATLLEHVVMLLRTLSTDVNIIGDRVAYHAYGVPVVSDAYPEAGALGGIATALRVAANERVLVVACDMPFLSMPLLSAMAAEPRDYDVLVPSLPADRSDQGGAETLEALHAIYAKRCLPAIERRIAAGQAKVVGFFDDVHVRRLGVNWLRTHDPELRSFTNVNNASDLDAAQIAYDSPIVRTSSGMEPRREYRKFLKDDGRLNVRLLPRSVYVDLLTRYRAQDHVITEVFNEHFWLWDLNEKERAARASGRNASLAELADEVIGEMDDNDWWQVMVGFEEHLQTHFAESPHAWADLLDPIYDLSERDGWHDRHYEPVKRPD
jgi:molybdopterin-guanine dinucleotide biosynthesis protein A